MTSKLAPRWLPCHGLGVIRLAFGLVGRCQYTITGLDKKLDLQLLSQCGSISAPEIHSFSVWQISAPEIHFFSVWQHICPRDTLFLSVAAYLPQRYTFSQCGSISAPEIHFFSVWQHICPRHTLFLSVAAYLPQRYALSQCGSMSAPEKERISGADMLPH